MKKFIIRLGLLALIMLAIDWGCGILAAKLFDTVNETDTAKWRAITKEIDDDVLLMGSSRCARHYNPAIISDSLGLSAYNCGKEGMGIFFAYGELQIILDRYKPKAIVYELTPEYDLYKTGYDNSRFLKPLYSFYGMDAVKEIVDDLQPGVKCMMHSQLYRNNETMAQYFKGLVKKQPASDNKGYKPLYGIADTASIGHVAHERPEIDPAKVRYLELFAERCKDNGIELAYCISPGSFDPAFCDDEAYAFFKTFAQQRGIPLIDNLRRPEFIGHPELFHDANHLNADGADKYSEIAASQLRPLLKCDRPDWPDWP